MKTCHACTSFQCVTPCVTVCFMITTFVGDTKTSAHNERVYLRSITHGYGLVGKEISVHTHTDTHQVSFFSRK